MNRRIRVEQIWKLSIRQQTVLRIFLWTENKDWRFCFSSVEIYQCTDNYRSSPFKFFSSSLSVCLSVCMFLFWGCPSLCCHKHVPVVYVLCCVKTSCYKLPGLFRALPSYSILLVLFFFVFFKCVREFY